MTARTVAVDLTAACEAGRGTILSLTAAHGAPCGCDCHGLGDLRGAV